MAAPVARSVSLSSPLRGRETPALFPGSAALSPPGPAEASAGPAERGAVLPRAEAPASPPGDLLERFLAREDQRAQHRTDPDSLPSQAERDQRWLTAHAELDPGLTAHEVARIARIMGSELSDDEA